jgi:hypothetical protein
MAARGNPAAAGGRTAQEGARAGGAATEEGAAGRDGPAAFEPPADAACADLGAVAAARRAEDAALREAVLAEALREVRAAMTRLREEIGEAVPGLETLVPLGLIVDEAALAALTPKLMPFFIEVTKRQVSTAIQRGGSVF